MSKQQSQIIVQSEAKKGANRIEFVLLLESIDYNLLLKKMPGKGKIGKKTAKRADIKKTERSHLTRGGIRRLARRGGVKRISDGVYSEVRDFVDYFLNIVVRDAAILCEVAKRKTITALDVVYSLKKSGRTIYGYGV
jgi:histone H3/H4